jgi:hypothetical protein
MVYERLRGPAEASPARMIGIGVVVLVILMVLMLVLTKVLVARRGAHTGRGRHEPTSSR